MGLDSKVFMEKMEKRISLTDTDKFLLENSANWEEKFASEMVFYFYNHLGHDPEMNAILNAEETGWTEGLFNRLIATGAGSI